VFADSNWQRLRAGIVRTAAATKKVVPPNSDQKQQNSDEKGNGIVAFPVF
jgi:hypothetical protein